MASGAPGPPMPAPSTTRIAASVPVLFYNLGKDDEAEDEKGGDDEEKVGARLR